MYCVMFKILGNITQQSLLEWVITSNTMISQIFICLFVTGTNISNSKYAMYPSNIANTIPGTITYIVYTFSDIQLSI